MTDMGIPPMVRYRLEGSRPRATLASGLHGGIIPSVKVLDAETPFVQRLLLHCNYYLS
jgi:hypothetical protein